MSDNQKILSKNGLILIGITSAAIFIVGMILLILGYNEAFYNTNPTIRAVFSVITNAGDEMVYIVIIAVILIVYDKKFAKNLLFSLLLTTYLNNFLKDIFQDPRPPANLDPSSEEGYQASGYGFPSGHSQSAVGVYGYMAYKFKDKSKLFVIPIIFSIFIFLIALSRIILGVHDLQDIVGGLLIGTGFLITFIYLEPIATEKINTFSLPLKILIVIVVSTLLFLLGTLLFPTSGQAPIKNPIPYADSGEYAVVCGAMFGFTVGYLLENEYVGYEPSEASNKQKILNLIVGLIIIFVLYFLLDLLISGNVVLRFIRYILLSFIISLLVPFVFTKINK
jgi:membrane-associated phospholipid phosphatase